MFHFPSSVFNFLKSEFYYEWWVLKKINVTSEKSKTKTYFEYNTASKSALL